MEPTEEDRQPPVSPRPSRVLTQEEQEQWDKVRGIYLKYARVRGLNKDRLVKCGPSRHEKEMRDRYDNWDHVAKKKIIFDSRQQAEDCAAELTREAGYAHLRAYQCSRSKSGHHHITGTGKVDRKVLTDRRVA